MTEEQRLAYNKMRRERYRERKMREAGIAGEGEEGGKSKNMEEEAAWIGKEEQEEEEEERWESTSFVSLTSSGEVVPTEGEEELEEGDDLMNSMEEYVGGDGVGGQQEGYSTPVPPPRRERWKPFNMLLSCVLVAQ